MKAGHAGYSLAASERARMAAITSPRRSVQLMARTAAAHSPEETGQGDR